MWHPQPWIADRSFAVAIVLTMVLAPPLSAQQDVLTEGEFLRLLEGEHPAITVLNAPLHQARAEESGVRQWPNPRLEFSRGELEFGGETVEETTEFAVSWEPPSPTERRRGIAAAQSEVAAAEATLEARRWALRQELRQAYARWAVAEARAQTLKEHGAHLSRLAEQGRLRAEAGESSGLEARRLALEAAAAQGELARAEGEVDRARAAIEAWWPELPKSARPRLPTLPTLPETSGMEESPTASHPQILAQEAQLQAARHRERALAPRFTLPEITLGWQREEAEGLRATGPTVGFGWSIPLTHPRRGQRAAAEALADSLAAELELIGRRVEAEWKGARSAYQRLRAAAREAERSADEATPAIPAVTRAYRLGEAPLTDLLDTLRATTEARLNALELIHQALKAHRELEALTGVSP